MKNYTITVNGIAYDVTVEEGASTPAAPQTTAKAAAAPVVSAAAPKTVSAPTTSDTEGSVKVTSPMPGKILAVKAVQGQSIKRGETIMVLEAMKMENDIVAPQDGIVVSINAAAGDSVEAGAALATLN